MTTVPFWDGPASLADHEGETFIGTIRSEKIGDNPREDVWLNDNGGDPELIRRYGDDAPENAAMPVRLYTQACLSPAWHRAFTLWKEWEYEIELTLAEQA